MAEGEAKSRKFSSAYVWLAAGCFAVLSLGTAVGVFGTQFFADVDEAVWASSMACVLWRSDVARARADLRSLSTALESYMVDHTQVPEGQALATTPDDKSRLAAMGGTVLATVSGLTTPVAYITKQDARDPFSGRRQFRFFSKGTYFTTTHELDALPYAYWRDAKRTAYILFSTGPDNHYDIDPATMYDTTQGKPSAALVNATYDPTNGTLSAGDIWRANRNAGPY